MQETDAKLNLLTRFSEYFADGRNPALIEHSAEQMVRQHVYALALGYEDLNDHDQPRLDPLLGALAGKAEPGRDRFYHGYYGTIATCRCTSSAASMCCARGCGR